jgi:hypothetical protein
MSEITGAKAGLDKLVKDLNIFDVKFYLNPIAQNSQEDAAAQAARWISASFKGELPKHVFPEYDLPA